MKLATYFQTEENHFCRLINLDETDLTPYDKVYVFSEAESQPMIPEAFRRADNVIFGGTAFTNGIYRPFENEIIDYTIARPHIYKSFLSDKYVAGLKDNVINHILDDSYYRMYAGSNKLPIPPILPHKRVYIYDTNFFIPEWKEILNKISNRNPSSIKPIHPVYCKTITDYFDLRGYQKFAKDANIILDLDIPLNEAPSLVRKYKNKFLADIKPSSNVFLTLGGNYETQYQYRQNFIYKLNLLYTFWSNDIPIKIKYITPSIGHNDPLLGLSQLISTWSSQGQKQTKCINDRIPKDKKITEIHPLRQEQNELLKWVPSAKTLFYQTFESTHKGGTWKNGY